jgi:hypothetical protein
LVAQVNCVALLAVLAVTPGAVILEATVTEAVAVHPVVGLVVVRVYVPAAVAVAVAPVAVKLLGPVQAKVVPEVVDAPVRVTLAVEQVRDPELVAVTPAGAVILEATVTEAVAVHPVVGLVAVRV